MQWANNAGVGGSAAACRRAAVALAAAVLAALGMAGCATDRSAANRTPPDQVAETARFYWQYAALAADVYRTGGSMDTKLALVASSPWLYNEITSAQDPKARENFERLVQRSRRNGARDAADGTPPPAAAPAVPAAASAAGTGVDAEVDEDEDPPDPANAYARAVPLTAKDCEYRGREEPSVPLHKAEQAFGWEPVPELQRQLHPRSWSIFVPGLAIDVWRRPRPPHGEAPVVEYALVYRGTVGAGSWFSNFRAVTAFTPLVWDQYRQARSATRSLIAQIHELHKLSDELFEREEGTRILLTTVGHSLGGGLATDVFMRVTDITRVVAFDPSPVNGTATLTPEELNPEDKRRGRLDRASVLRERKQPLDRDPRDEQAAIFVLYEEGEILTRVTGCQNGPFWGAEGGPSVRCDSLDLSGGNILRQHNMAQLACKLYLAQSGLPTR